jgi:hypothetical protein
VISFLPGDGAVADFHYTFFETLNFIQFSYSTIVISTYATYTRSTCYCCHPGTASINYVFGELSFNFMHNSDENQLHAALRTTTQNVLKRWYMCVYFSLKNTYKRYRSAL